MKLSYIIDNILEAKTNLLRNVPRTILTSLGIVIGITSVIILVAITDGAKNIIEPVSYTHLTLPTIYSV